MKPGRELENGQRKSPLNFSLFKIQNIVYLGENVQRVSPPKRCQADGACSEPEPNLEPVLSVSTTKALSPASKIFATAVPATAVIKTRQTKIRENCFKIIRNPEMV